MALNAFSQPRILPGAGKLLAVASGKGGVGKTTVSVNLALALVSQGARVGLFDADLYGPNVPLLLGITRSAPGGGEVPIARMQREPYISPLEFKGLKVMSMGLVLSSQQTVLADPRFQGHVIRQTMQDVLWGGLDFLLVDFPPGSGEPQQTLLNSLKFDGVILVTTPQDLALMDASRSLGLFKATKTPVLGMVENMSYMVCPHCGERIETFSRSSLQWAIEDEGIELLGKIPFNIEVSRGILQGESSQEIRAIFDSIARRLAEKTV